MKLADLSRPHKALIHRYNVVAAYYKELFEEMTTECTASGQTFSELAKDCKRYQPTLEMRKILSDAAGTYHDIISVYIDPVVWSQFSKYGELIRLIHYLHELVMKIDQAHRP